MLIFLFDALGKQFETLSITEKVKQWWRWQELNLPNFLHHKDDSKLPIYPLYTIIDISVQKKSKIRIYIKEQSSVVARLYIILVPKVFATLNLHKLAYFFIFFQGQKVKVLCHKLLQERELRARRGPNVPKWQLWVFVKMPRSNIIPTLSAQTIAIFFKRPFPQTMLTPYTLFFPRLNIERKNFAFGARARAKGQIFNKPIPCVVIKPSHQ